MCHRYTLRTTPERIAKEFLLSWSPVLEIEKSDRYPIYDVAAIRLDDEGERELTSMSWGLLPSWWKPSVKHKSRKSFQRSTFNARSETMDSKPSFRSAFKARRALIPVTAFFEKDYYFSLTDKDLFAFAGLWETWHDEGESIVSCTIVTTEANDLVAKYHPRKRMPVILDGEDAYRRWLNPDIVERESLEELLIPFDVNRMQCEPAT